MDNESLKNLNNESLVILKDDERWIDSRKRHLSTSSDSESESHDNNINDKKANPVINWHKLQKTNVNLFDRLRRLERYNDFDDPKKCGTKDLAILLHQEIKRIFGNNFKISGEIIKTVAQKAATKYPESLLIPGS